MNEKDNIKKNKMKQEREIEEERQKILNALMKDLDFRRKIIVNNINREIKEEHQGDITCDCSICWLICNIIMIFIWLPFGVW